MSTDNVQGHGRSGRAQPSAVAGDGLSTDIRVSRFGEQYVTPFGRWRYAAADEGSYFYFHNATNDASTTVAGHAAPVLADADVTMTKPLIHIASLLGVSSTQRIYLDFLEIEVVTAGANGTQACWATQIDTGATRITSAGTAATLVNPNMQSSAVASSAVSVTLGAIVVGAESTSVRHLSHGTHRPSIEIAGDRYMHVFGADPDTVAVQGNAAAAAVRNFAVYQPPVILGPSDAFLFALHGQASQNAAGIYKIRGGLMVR